MNYEGKQLQILKQIYTLVLKDNKNFMDVVDAIQLINLYCETYQCNKHELSLILKEMKLQNDESTIGN